MNWQSQIIELLTASLIRPIVLAAAAWLILRIYKVRHPASRHAVWTTVLIGMMVLPLVSVFAPQWTLPVLPKKPEPVARIQVQQPDDFTSGESSGIRPNAAVSAPSAWPTPQKLIVWCYFAGVLAMVIFRLMGWTLLWRVMSKSRVLRTRLLESNEVTTPVTVGVFRPSVILPAGWREWSAGTKRAVLAHEFAHIRRHDTLTSSLTRLAKCLYWFHPLAWWISRQMSELAELSCDAAALEINGDPGSYSRILLGFAETVHAAGYRVALPGLAIASRSGMSHRIDQVFELASGNLRRLSRPGAVLVLMGLPVMCIAAVVGLTAPAARVLHKAAAAIIPSAPVVLAQLQPPVAVPAKPAQPAPAPKPKFDVATVKPCSEGDGTGGRGGRGGGAGLSTSPGRLNIACMSVWEMMYMSYVKLGGEPLFQNVSSPTQDPQRIRGGPAWIKSDLYTIEAETNDPEANGPTAGASQATWLMESPMLQALLESRFQLKTHHEVEQVRMYALTLAKGGLKLKPMEDGDCISDYPRGNPPSPAPGEKPLCTFRMGIEGPNWKVDSVGRSLSQLSRSLALILGSPVPDKTGIPGNFNIHLEFAHDENTPGSSGGAPEHPSDIPAGPSIFTAMERLGLRLESTKGPNGFIVIDRVERPSEN